MAKTKKNQKRLKLWRCITCDCFVDHPNRRYHKGHVGRWGTPTTAFFDEHREVRFVDGSNEWHPKTRTFQTEGT
jgi:hypothetical protein